MLQVTIHLQSLRVCRHSLLHRNSVAPFRATQPKGRQKEAVSIVGFERFAHASCKRYEHIKLFVQRCQVKALASIGNGALITSNHGAVSARLFRSSGNDYFSSSFFLRSFSLPVLSHQSGADHGDGLRFGGVSRASTNKLTIGGDPGL